jgi:hypothetical protein
VDVTRAAELITDLVETEGLALVHDQRLPSATALVAGGPVPGSWWSHPLANVIYDALESLEGRLALCKLVSRKLTLVAPRLWPDLAAVGSGRLDWQLGGLSGAETALLAEVDAAAGPVALDRKDLRAAGRRLEERLLVAAHDVHTDAGHHVKVLTSWHHWCEEREVGGSLPPAEAAMRRFEEIAARWSPSRRLLPWPAGGEQITRP